MEKIPKFDKCMAINKAVVPEKQSKIDKCRTFVNSGLKSKKQQNLERIFALASRKWSNKKK